MDQVSELEDALPYDVDPVTHVEICQNPTRYNRSEEIRSVHDFHQSL